jgi:hypothetical protein
MNTVRIIINWLLYLTGPIWMPVFFYILEICLIKKMLSLPKDKRCENYRALFVGDRWFLSASEIKDCFTAEAAE